MSQAQGAWLERERKAFERPEMKTEYSVIIYLKALPMILPLDATE
jgi:hypothetical protein